MSLHQKDNGDGTITFSIPETGKTWPPIAKTEIAAADARRSSANQPPLAGDVFLSRLTDAEYIAIKAAAAAQEAAGNAQLSRWIEILRATNRINLAGTEAQAVKIVLVADGLLTAPRADIAFAP